MLLRFFFFFYIYFESLSPGRGILNRAAIGINTRCIGSNKSIIRFASRNNHETRWMTLSVTIGWERLSAYIKRGQSAKSGLYARRWKSENLSVVLFFALGIRVRWGEDWLNNADIGDRIRRPLGLHVIDYSNAFAWRRRVDSSGIVFF